VDAHSRLAHYWHQQGLDVRPVGAADLARVEQRLGVELPESFTSALAQAGVPSADDKEMFLWWPPQQWQLTADVLAAAGYAHRAGHASVVFMDYMQESWWYSLWVDGPHLGYVSLALGTSDGCDPQPPIAAFDEFVSLYVADDESLYPTG
jgi:hypothetical protein